jgi:hypothetical protein
MWKLALGFVVFAAVGLFVLKKAGGDVDMGGEKHDCRSSRSRAQSAAALELLPRTSPGPTACTASSSYPSTAAR